MEELIQLVDSWPGIVAAMVMVLGGFSQLAQFTPNESDNAFFQKVWDVVNILAGNNGKAKNGQ